MLIWHRLYSNAGEYLSENIKIRVGFLGNSVSLYFNEQLDEKLKKFIFYATKHLLKNFWNTFYLSDIEKLKIKNLFRKKIGGSLLNKNSLLEIGFFMGEILLVDSIEKWTKILIYFKSLLDKFKITLRTFYRLCR